MKAKSEGRRHPPAKRPACRRPGAGRWAGNEECRSGEKLGSGIRAQPLGCRGLRQLWRTRERRQIVESAVTVPREVLRTVYVRRVVEREGVIKFLTVRCCARPLGECRRQASTPPLLATCATSNRTAVGSGIGAVRRPRLAWAVCG